MCICIYIYIYTHIYCEFMKRRFLLGLAAGNGTAQSAPTPEKGKRQRGSSHEIAEIAEAL